MSDLYAMSDLHGMLGPLQQRLEQLNINEIRSGRAKLLLLGDYIDRGMNSLGCYRQFMIFSKMLAKT